MAKFQVPPELHPCVYRAGVGCFAPGAVIELPDAASQPGDVVPRGLIPLDKDAHEMLLDSNRRRAETAKAWRFGTREEKIKDVPPDAKATLAAGVTVLSTVDRKADK